MRTRQSILFDRPVLDLAREFNMMGNPRRFPVPKRLHHYFAQMHVRSSRLVEQLKLVINDGEHRLILEEGRATAGFILPDPDFMAKEVEELEGLLRRMDPFFTESAGGDQVWVTMDQMQGFFDVFSKDWEIVAGIFDMFRKTDYLPYHRYLRDELGVKYAGPTSLQEIMNVYVGLARALKMQYAYQEDLRLEIESRRHPPQNAIA